MECQAADLALFIEVVDVDIGASLTVLGALTDSEVSSIGANGHAGELNTRLAEDGLFTGFGVFDDYLVV